MGKTLYLECYSGISGDMTVGALLDLGAREEALREALGALPLKGYEITIGRTKKCGIDACDFDVILEEEEGQEPLHHHGGEAHTHDHEQQNCQQANADQRPVHPIERMEHGCQAGKKIGRRHLRRSSVSRDAAALFPSCVIAQ